ncbi:MAG: hypothetical protein IIZ57_02320 [Solobacterium sp.]|nr:hypothetical protein [Solobacterium sp.]
MADTSSGHRKLYMRFVLLTAGVFLILWLLQSVFAQGFYRMAAERTARRTADQITAHSRSEDLFEEIDRLSTENALLIFVTEQDGTILYSSDSYKSFYHSYGNGDGGTSNPYIYDDVMEWQTGNYRKLPDGYGDFLTSLRNNDRGTTELKTDSKYICGRYVELENGEQAILYIGTVLNTGNPAVSFIRGQLFWTAFVSLIIAGVTALYLLEKTGIPWLR